MAIEVSLSADGIGAIYTSSGVLTGQDLLDALVLVGEEARRNPGFRYLLIDHSAIPDESVDTASLEEVASRSDEILELIPEVMVAIAAPSDVLFGLSRMWQLFGERVSLTTRVTRTRVEAVEWLQDQLDQRRLPFQLTR